MAGSEIDAIRALLTSKPRPEGWAARRERLDEVGSIWAPAPDVSSYSRILVTAVGVQAAALG